MVKLLCQDALHFSYCLYVVRFPVDFFCQFRWASKIFRHCVTTMFIECSLKNCRALLEDYIRVSYLIILKHLFWAFSRILCIASCSCLTDLCAIFSFILMLLVLLIVTCLEIADIKSSFVFVKFCDWYFFKSPCSFMF